MDVLEQTLYLQSSSVDSLRMTLSVFLSTLLMYEILSSVNLMTLLLLFHLSTSLHLSKLLILICRLSMAIYPTLTYFLFQQSPHLYLLTHE